MRFDLLNKALTDREISDSQFRTLYLILNNCNMKNTESIEMYNAFLMDKLCYSESTVKRCTKGLEKQGYINIERATKKKTPNIITLIPITNIKNECKNEVKNDTLNKNNINIKEIKNIQSNNIQSNSTIQSIAVQSNDIEDNGIDYDVYCEQYFARERAMRQDNVVNKTVIQNNSSNSEQQASTSQNKSNGSIDWNAWRSEFEDSKIKMLNSTCKTNFDLFNMKIHKSLNFAKEHMRAEKYEQVSNTYQKWFAASQPYFYYNRQGRVNPMENPTKSPQKEFSENTWDSYKCQLNYSDTAEERLKVARQMLQYLRDCNIDPKMLIADLQKTYGITIPSTIEEI